MGLPRPAEFAGSVAYLRETEALEVELKGDPGAPNEDGRRGPKLEKWVSKKGQEDGGAGEPWPLPGSASFQRHRESGLRQHLVARLPVQLQRTHNIYRSTST